MFCQFCGAEVDKEAVRCPACGKPNPTGGPPATPPLPPPNSSTGEYVPPEQVTVKIGEWVGEGWRMVKEDMGLFILLSLTFIVMNAFVPILLQGSLLAGYHTVCMNKLIKGRFEFGDLFKGFNFFVGALVASIIISIFTFAGTLLCIIPGFVVAAMYMFTYLFILDRKMEFWPAMQASHAIVKKDYVGFTLFFVVAAVLMNLLGALCCIVGVLVTMPIHFGAVTAAYRDTAGFESSSGV